MVREFLVQGGHIQETVAVQIVPDLFVDGPQVFLVHDLPQDFGRRDARASVFGVETVHPAAALGGGVLVVTHRVYLFVRAAVMDAAAFGLHLIAARTIQPFNEFAYAGDLVALVRIHVIGQCRMVADAPDGRCYIRPVHILVLRVLGVAGDPEFLPDHDAVFVAEAIEIGRFLDAATPQADQVDAALAGVAQFRGGAFRGHAKHPLRNPVGSPYENPFSVHVKLAGAVRRIAIRHDVADAEDRTHGIGQGAIHKRAEFQLIQVLRPLVHRPPQAGLVDDQLRVFFGCEGDFQLLSPVHQDVLFKGNAFAHNFSLDGYRNRCHLDGRIHQRHAHLLAGTVETGFVQGGADHGPAHLDGAGGVDGNTFPDTGVAVANAIHKGEIPAHGHEHGGVQADGTIAAVVEFTGSAPGLEHGFAGYIHGKDLDGQGVALSGTGIIGDVHPFLLEHAARGGQQGTVHPNFGPIIDALQPQPDVLSAIAFRQVEFRAEPGGVKVAPGLAQIRDGAPAPVVQAIVGLRIYLIIYQGVEHRSRNDGLHPGCIVIDRVRYLFPAIAEVLEPGHFPIGRTLMEWFGVKADGALRRHNQAGESHQSGK